MVTVLNVIEELCGQVSGVEVNKPTPAFVRQHIFHAILIYCSQGESAESRLDMMFRFDQFEKFVASIKRREHRQTQHLLEAIDGSKLRLATDLAQSGMDSLYYPAVALKDYFDGNHDAALESLTMSLGQFNRLFDHGFGEAVFGMVEMNLNKVRVLVAAGHKQDAINETLELFDFMCGERGGPTYKREKLAAHYDVTGRDTLVAHYMDELLIKFLESAEDGLVDCLMRGLYERCESWLPGNVRNAVGLLQHLSTRSDQPGCSRIDDFSIDLRCLPFSLQFILVKALVARSGCEWNDDRVDTVKHFLSLSSKYGRLAKCRWGADAFGVAQTAPHELAVRLSRELLSTEPA
jgi:hypothetical protein